MLFNCPWLVVKKTIVIKLLKVIKLVKEIQ